MEGQLAAISQTLGSPWVRTKEMRARKVFGGCVGKFSARGSGTQVHLHLRNIISLLFMGLGRL